MPRILIISNPRSGSNFLLDLLNDHPEIHFESELLNDEIEIHGCPLKHIEKNLSSHPETFVGFKVFPEQIFKRNLNFSSIILQLGITHVVVLWRENILETLTSRRIADATGEWYLPNEISLINGIQKPPTKIKIDPEDLEEYTKTTKNDWRRIADDWPAGLSPIYVKFEDLISNPVEQVRQILSSFGCSPDNFTTTFPSKRQNPAKLEDKVENYSVLPEQLKTGRLNVKELFSQRQIRDDSAPPQLPKETLQYAPDREPNVPPSGWRYRVAEPFITSNVKQNVLDAIESGSISSAGYYPRLLASTLRHYFQCPVAQPCSNGFTALMLALQAANVGKGDEVIVPSMSMVAVPNSAYFLSATPVFADCAEGNYNPGWDELLASSSDKTKAIILTHTYGVPTPQLEKIVEECEKRGWWLIEDISEAVGVLTTTQDGSSKLLGTFGHFACASMYVNKMVHAGDGGFVVAKEARASTRLASLANHAFTPKFHFVHYEPALNAKINGLGAAIACGTFQEIDNVMQHRAMISKEYREALRGLPLRLMPACGPSDTPWVFGLLCTSKKERTRIRAYLAGKGIETRDFFFALHLQPAYYKKEARRLPLSEELGSKGFYLPTHSNLQSIDIKYITTCIKMYFSSSTVAMGIPLQPPEKRDKQSVQIERGSFNVQIRTFYDSGCLKRTESRSHIYYDAVSLGIEAEKVLIHERYDAKAELLMDIKELLKRAEEGGEEMRKEIKRFFDPYLQYFESQLEFEEGPMKPWMVEDISGLSPHIPTTSDPETLKLLLYLVKERRPRCIWEIGCWMGHTTHLLGALLHKLSIPSKIFACDAFKWQKWMERYTELKELLPGQSFLSQFKDFVSPFASFISPVVWPYQIDTLPSELREERADLIYLDITQDEEDLDGIWELIKYSLIPGQSVILFNGLSYKSIPFFTKHSDELKAIAKPATLAKAFIFKPEVKVEEYSGPGENVLNFQTDPGWTHHHKNLFCSSIALLRERFHEPSAPVLFFPAVEERMCDEPQLFLRNPWIGIIHSVPYYPQLFYTPDLMRLCSAKYQPMMDNCKGLFTLTNVQANFLRENLSEHTFPIQPIKYPVEEVPLFVSTVPERMEGGETVDLLCVGSFARDFPFFFNLHVSENRFRKVMVAGDEESVAAAMSAPSDVKILQRLGQEEYENVLRNSIPFLSLLYDGAANTIILECIARNVPILSPRLASCVEYLGKDYPLLYDQQSPESLEGLLTVDRVRDAIEYLRSKLDKSQLSPQHLLESISKGAVLQSLPTTTAVGENGLCEQYDVTVCICAYKRTQHLPQILQSLWTQDFDGRIQIIVWNNNDSRYALVKRICSPYVKQSNKIKSFELISSTQNYYCSVRFAMPPLMRSDCLLICDDDIIPGANFIRFFMEAHAKHGRDVLCVRGHTFLPHTLNLDNPSELWEEYEHLRFKGDEAPEQFIHFVHADACLIPKAALREVASVEMPDPAFAFVDDYWMSYILNKKFNRALRKLSTAGCVENPVNRTDDSDQIGLALHTKAEVRHAKIKFYIHHMLQGWPSWPKEVDMSQEESNVLREKKSKFYSQPQIGFNISSKITREEIQDLVEMGVSAVRIGAVGIGQEVGFDLCQFLTNPDHQIKKLEDTVKCLGDFGITSMISLDRRLATVETWELIASRLFGIPHVVGYDLINEPFTEMESRMHWTQLQNSQESDPGILSLVEKYKSLIQAIRKFDEITPIVIEFSYWARYYAVPRFPINQLKSIDSNIILAFHFYEPMVLTQRGMNQGRYKFPGDVPIYKSTVNSEMIKINEDFIEDQFRSVKKWGDEHGVKVILGECGICRDIKGADKYMGAILNACKVLGMSAYVFSFRDKDWDGMDYELGPSVSNFVKLKTRNCLMETILKYVNGSSS